MSAHMQRLGKSLFPIYELELRLGNAVASVDEPAGSECPLAIRFQRPLHTLEIRRALTLDSSVAYMESTDTHYSIENGYKCQVTGHAILGPLLPGRRGW